MYSAESKVDVMANGFAGNPAPMHSPDAIEQAIVRTVAYADVFDYPMRPSELWRYLIETPCDQDQLADKLASMLSRSYSLDQGNDHLFLRGREEIVAVREKREARSRALWPAAVYYGRLIAQLPFVRMVAVTGSLAVNNIGDFVDIDYFIITADDYLWLTRAMVIAVVRQAARQGIELCPNFFLSERALLITDQTLYTAHEIAQMVPLYGKDVYDRFRAINDWTEAFLPNAVGSPAVSVTPSTGRTWLGRTAERVLRTPSGRGLNNWEMRRKINKLSHSHSNTQETNFTANCCKGHFNSHQNRALRAYEDRLAAEPGSG